MKFFMLKLTQIAFHDFKILHADNINVIPGMEFHSLKAQKSDLIGFISIRQEETT